jgi:hypothetical protein
MQHFSRYLLIGIILTLSTFIVYGLFVDADITLQSKVRVKDSSKKHIDQLILKPNHIKNWSVILQDSSVQTVLDEKSIDWKYPGQEKWGTISIAEEAGDIVYSIVDPNDMAAKMSFETIQDGNAVEIRSVYSFEINFIFRFFKKSLKAKMQESSDKNLDALREYAIGK